MRGVLERLERITAVRDSGIAAPRKAELILMDMEIVQLVGAVDQLPYLAAMEGRADMWTGREVVTGVAVRPRGRKLQSGRVSGSRPIELGINCLTCAMDANSGAAARICAAAAAPEPSSWTSASAIFGHVSPVSVDTPATMGPGPVSRR